MIETTSADATRDGYKGSAKPLTLKMRRRFLSISIPPSHRPPFRKARRDRVWVWMAEKVRLWFFDKTIIPICICLITWCVNLQPFRFNLACFNAVSRWAKDFLSRASIYFLKLLFSVRSVCLFFLWGLILVPAGRSHLENTEYRERRGQRRSKGGWRVVCVCGGGDRKRQDRQGESEWESIKCSLRDRAKNVK